MPLSSSIDHSDINLGDHNDLKGFYRVARIVPKYGYCYINMPKSAGGSIKEILTRCDMQIGKKDSNSDIPNGLQGQGHLEKILFSRLNEGDGFLSIYHAVNTYKVFTFVRNPFARILSGYNEKILKTYKMLSSIESISDLPVIDRRKLKRRILRLKELGFTIDSPPSFEVFINAVTSVPFRNSDQHFAPQAYLGAYNSIPYDFVGRVEAYDKDIKKLLKILYGKQFYLEKDPSENSIPRNYSGALDTELCHHITPSTIEKINSYYACDFEAFGYSGDINKVKQIPEAVRSTRDVVSPSLYRLQLLGIQSKTQFVIRYIKRAIRNIT